MDLVKCGLRLKKARQIAGLSISQVSKLSEGETTGADIRCIERGVHTASVEQFEFFSDKYNANLDWLHGGVGNKKIFIPEDMEQYLDETEFNNIIEILHMAKN